MNENANHEQPRPVVSPTRQDRTDPGAPEPDGVSLPDRFAVLVHPVRLRVLGEFAGRRRTTRQLAAALPDVAQATLYRHVGALLDAGVLEVVARDVVNGAVERTLAIADGQARIAPQDLAGATSEQHQAWFSTFVASLVDTFTSALAQQGPADLVAAGLAYQRAVVHLDHEEHDEYAARLADLVGEMTAIEPAPHRRPHTLASVVVPRPLGDTP